jgi:hypothetical protein
MTDARFEDGADQPLRLMAQSADDLPTLSALLQDAVFPITEMQFDRRRRRFALLVNRFRWEDRGAAEAQARAYERVRSVVVVEDVLAVRTSGIDRTDADTILSLLSVTFEPGAETTGRLILTLAGDGAVALEVEALDLRIEDVSRPYVAASRHKPDHGA